MLKAEKRLQMEFDYWVKHFNRRLNNALDLLQSQQEAIERLDEHIESLVKYNQKTVHPNLVRLWKSVEIGIAAIFKQNLLKKRKNDLLLK